MDLDPSQELAVELGCTVPFGVITGGPGTGKSTCVRTVLDRLDRRRVSYALAAPTGKAARRMYEATGRSASTIHRLLEWSRDGFVRNRHNPIEADVVIIDEASMLDVELAADLVDACGERTRLIFVGDANQLPSVGPGRVFADLVESDAVPVARLTHVHRSAAESWICRNAPRVLAGEPLELGSFPDFRFFDVEDVGDAAAVVRRIVRMPEFQGAQVLAPQKNTAIGVEALNLALQAELNPKLDPHAVEWALPDRTLRVKDRVIQTVNNYDLNVMNGEVGDVVAVTGEELVVDFGDRSVAYPKGQALSLQLAYALTVHKCQGSEFAWAVCVVHSAHSYMLTRQLFYTAITRAKVGVVIVGNRKGIEVATSAKLPPVRNTALVERMRQYAADNDNEEPADDRQGAISW
jgi:exodeoxyribonuclease V alpha subunit